MGWASRLSVEIVFSQGTEHFVEEQFCDTENSGKEKFNA